jgi:hypothetical protein
VQSVDDDDAAGRLKVGLVQCLGMIPGTSRSGSTIIGGMLLGLSRKAATDFSFFLAIPTLVAAGGYSLWKERARCLADVPMFASASSSASWPPGPACAGCCATCPATPSCPSPGTASPSASSCWRPGGRARSSGRTI